jgi:phage tail sheath protein FI
MTLYSPGVEVKEKDFSTIVPTVSSGIGGAVGRFTRGPVMTPILVTSESDLVNIFGSPQDNVTANDWFNIAEFLRYTNKCWVVRANNAANLNAVATGSAVSIDDSTDFYNQQASLVANGSFIARDSGSLGNSIEVVAMDFTSGANYANYGFTYKPSETEYVKNLVLAGDAVAKKDELHIAVIDKLGKYSGTPGTVLESFQGLSKASDAKNFQGQSTYYVNYVNNNSKYVYAANSILGTVTTSATVLAIGTTALDLVATSGKSFADLGASSTAALYDVTLSGGADAAASAYTQANITDAYDLLANTELYDVNLFPLGAFGGLSGYAGAGPIETYVVQNVVYARKDAMAFVTPHANGLPLTGANTSAVVTATTNFKETTVNLSEMYAQYAVMDTGFKWIYDKYNSKYRWVPLAGDIAGLCARTDDIADPWWSPGGFNRGAVKNVIKLSLNPNQAQRDILYPKGINPVVSFPGQGVVLFGDRTMTTKPSAFDRINVRRLFNILEKAIAIAAKYQLFEFNDSFTRAQFKNMVEPYLRNIQGRRGITDFMVLCDETNNTGIVIDSNQFVAEIFIKPARSINFITLNFVATRTDVQFSTLIGA